MSLVDVRDTLLQIAHPERILEYADDLMELRRRQGDMFKLNQADQDCDKPRPLGRGGRQLATSVAIKKGLLLDTKAEKERYAIRCSKYWEKAREALLKNVRAASPTGRVSQSHREELLEEFWSNVEQSLNNGEIPKP